MTRFARAKGSKASNERVPEDSTPWEVMKDQLLKSKKENEEAKKREEAEKQRIENYENFLKDRKIQKRKATWCDFPESVYQNSTNGNSEILKKVKKIKLKSKHSENENSFDVNEDKVNTTDKAINENNLEVKSKKKKNKRKINLISTETENNETQNSNNKNQHFYEPKSKKKQNTSNIDMKSNEIQNNKIQEIPNKGLNSTNNETELVIKKQKKSKKKNKLNSNNATSQENAEDEKPTKEFEKNSNIKSNNQFNKKEKKIKKNKSKKLDNGEHARRKPLTERSFQLIINGKEVELVRFDGFPIMKKDAERLEELKNSMVKKGIPKSEVQRTIKLERRRAEKALARLKRDVCYNCRKGGHNLSDCPELKSKIPGVDAAEGVCFKCGSTEHRQFECKVQRDKEFRFATCFICKEAGHIARQCPDNPKGLYPNGGCCKLCGDVTHLRKDCPTVKDKKEETSIKLQTLDNAENIEGIDQKFKSSPTETVKKPKKIKF